METRLQYVKSKIAELVEQLKVLQTKIDVYSDRDLLAAGIHRTKYMELDAMVLDLMVEEQELEAGLPPDHTNLIIEPLFT